MGDRHAVGRCARRLRLVRCADQLRLRARLPRRSPLPQILAAHLAPDRQGHPAPARHVLADHAQVGRPAAAGAHPGRRLPVGIRRTQDEQVARQRARPVRARGPLRHRRRPLLPAAHPAVRQRRQRRRGRPGRTLQRRPGQRSGQPDVAVAHHGQPPSGRHHRRAAAGAARTRGAGARRRPGRYGARPDRQDARERRPGGGPAVRAPLEPLLQRPAAVGTGQGPAGERTPANGALHRGGGAAHRRGAAYACHAGQVGDAAGCRGRAVAERP